MIPRALGATLLAAGIAQAGPLSSEDTWLPGGPMARPMAVDVPAGAVPAGPAEVWLDVPGQVSFRHRLRVDLPSEGRRDLRIWAPYWQHRGSDQGQLHVRSEAGSTWSERVTFPEHAISKDTQTLFAGSADELADFDWAVRSRARTPADAQTLLAGIRLVPRDTVAGDCRTLIGVDAVIAVGGDPAVLADCAARGARILSIGDHLPGMLPGTVHRWGLGALAWAPRPDADGAQTTPSDSAGEAALKLHAWRQGFHLTYGFVPGMDGLTRVGGEDSTRGFLPGHGVVLGLLLAYVAILGPVGHWVGVRRRRVWFAWAWFPLVALVVTAAVGVTGSVLHDSPSELRLRHQIVAAPSGVGLERTSAEFRAAHAKTYAVTLPWDQNSELEEVHTPFRFGTPFRRPGGGVMLREDEPSGSMHIDHLAVGRRGRLTLSFVAPSRWRVASAVPLRGDAWQVVNGPDFPVKRALLLVAERWAWLDALKPGETRSVTLSSRALPLPSSDWRVTFLDSIREGLEGGYVLACETIGAKPRSLQVTPNLPIHVEDLRITVGPAHGEEQP